MANPQLEDGYTKIANELFDALIIKRMPGEQRQVFDFILRKTYGESKKKENITLSQFVEATGIKKQNVLRTLKTLKNRHIISVIKTDYGDTTSYGINKDYTRWKALSKLITVIKTDNKPLPKKATKTKKEYTQEFLIFLQAYPGKKNKDYAFECWQKQSIVRPPLQEILTAIAAQVIERKQQRDAGKRFIAEWKNASTWINQGCWNDVVEKIKNRVASQQLPIPKIDTEDEAQARKETEARLAKLTKNIKEMP